MSAGPLFGELLAFEFSGWADHEGLRPLVILESGAHDGSLASDILSWFCRHRPDVYRDMSYLIVESSTRREGWQVSRLEKYAPKVRWVHDLKDVGSVHGVIFCNELLDALPVHRLVWSRQFKRWLESGVALVSDRLENCLLEIADSRVLNLAPGTDHPVLEFLPEGFVLEVSPAAVDWWRKAAQSLRKGKLLTLDYGLSDEDLYSAARVHGTLRAYRGHRCTTDLLASPGHQDLTAHVDFPAIQKAGEDRGLRTETFVSQGRWLGGIVTRIPPGHSFFPPWDRARTRQFATLTHPDHLGHSFKVLVQARETKTAAG